MINIKEKTNDAQKKLIERLAQNNKDLIKEITLLREQLKEQQLIIDEAKKYKEEHEKILSYLITAKDKYDNALSLLAEERKKYKREIDIFIKENR